MKTSLAAVLLVSLTARASGPVYWQPDGGLAAVETERAALLVPGAGEELLRVMHVDGGTWVSTHQRILEGQKRAELTARVDYLEKHAGDVPAAALGGVAAAGVAAGAIIAIASLAAAGMLKLP